MKSALASLLLATWISSSAQAAIDISSTTVSDPHALSGAILPMTTSYLPLNVFPEKLIFDVAWGIIGVGQATLEVQDIVDFNGRPAYHIVSRAMSNAFCDGFYKVRDLNESWFDAATHTSLGYSKQLREGHFFRDEWVLYQDGRWLSKTTNRDGHYSFAAGTVPVKVQDVLSSMYYIRGQPLEPGKDVVLDVNTRQNWPLAIRVIKKERIKVPAGRFDAYLVEPGMRHEGIFIQKGTRLQIWLADDATRMPVMMKVDVFFGSITAKLSKVVQ